MTQYLIAKPLAEKAENPGGTFYGSKRQLIAGRFINEIDMKEQRKNVVLSRSQAKELSKDYRSLVGMLRIMLINMILMKKSWIF